VAARDSEDVFFERRAATECRPYSYD
jgi:hypothetical protein